MKIEKYMKIKVSKKDKRLLVTDSKGFFVLGMSRKKKRVLAQLKKVV